MINKNLLTVLHRAFMQPFSLQSDYARENSEAVAELASRGLITTLVWGGPPPQFGRHWRPSTSGLVLLEHTNLSTKSE